jgi:hypothetical protein
MTARKSRDGSMRIDAVTAWCIHTVRNPTGTRKKNTIFNIKKPTIHIISDTTLK